MTRRSTPPEARKLSLDEMQIGVARLARRIAELAAFEPAKVAKRFGSETEVFQKSIEETLADVFGGGTSEFLRYRSAARLDNGPLTVSNDWAGRSSREDAEFRQYLEEGKGRSIALLGQAVKGLKERIELLAQSGIGPTITLARENDSSKVFLVHGHDEAARESVARFLEKIGLDVVILHERPNKGRALITKFREEAAGIGFAVVLMSPDDVGGTDPQKLRERARQNVVFELGFFIGALGPDRVAALAPSSVECPSDYEGVVYLSLDDGNWRIALGKELEAAGFKIDWNRVMT